MDSAEQGGGVGRAGVRAHLIDPLVSDGLTRARGVSVTDHDAFLDRVAGGLAYMTAESLDKLRPRLVALATGTARNVWPSWISLWNQAVIVQTPPDRQNPIMQSWLHSVEGPWLRDEGIAVEMYQLIRRTGRPPTKFDLTTVRADAADNRRRKVLISERRAAQDYRPDDDRWLEGRVYLEQLVDGLIEAGIAHRAALKQSQEKVA